MAPESPARKDGGQCITEIGSISDTNQNRRLDNPNFLLLAFLTNLPHLRLNGYLRDFVPSKIVVNGFNQEDETRCLKLRDLVQ